MSQENVEIVRDAAAAFNRGDVDTWLEYFADDIDYRAVEGALDDRGPMHGKDAVRAYVQDWLDMFDDFKVEPMELVDAGGPGHRGRADQRTRQAERRRDRSDLRRPLHDPRREDRAGPRVLDEGAGPRSRRAAGRMKVKSSGRSSS